MHSIERKTFCSWAKRLAARTNTNTKNTCDTGRTAGRGPVHLQALREAPADTFEPGGGPRTDVIDGWQRKVMNTTTDRIRGLRQGEHITGHAALAPD